MSTSSRWSQLQVELLGSPRRWLITGVAGFIGSNLLECLLKLDQEVVGLDNLSTGRRQNLDDVRQQVGEARWRNFRFIEGDITDLPTCQAACAGIHIVLHQAALGSVPRSIKTPLDTHHANVTGFVTVLEAARTAGIKRIVYASSSSVYGDHPDLPKREEITGNVLSPYAATKIMNEIYAGVWARCYGMELLGLRYFNVFGRRQDPDGAYAAVIPKWIAQMLRGEVCHINGDGETSRDFCYIANVCQANILAATVTGKDAVNRAYNVACGAKKSLNELHAEIRADLPGLTIFQRQLAPVHEMFRPGDIRHSLADISAAQSRLGYTPTHTVAQGLQEALGWYAEHLGAPLASKTPV